MERNYDFRKRLSQVHKPNRRNDDVYKRINGTVVDDYWEIVYPDDADRVMKNAALDLREYFEVSMGVYLKAVPASKADCCCSKIILENNISDNVCLYSKKSSYRLIVEQDRIIINGTDPRGTAQGVYYLEDQMNLNEGPVIQLQDISRRPMYSPRMIHSGYGLDMFPDEHLRTIAHNGMDAILVFTKDVNITPHGYLDFNDLIYRAEGYGIDVYIYSYYKNDKHPDDEGARESYDATYGRLFKECPGLKGIVFVGESMEFPSKDEHTTGIPRHLRKDKTPQPKPSPGWYPCYDYPQWISLIRDIIRDKKPDADIVFWTYNWGYVNEEARLKLIRELPTDISLLATYEMFEQFDISETVKERCVDYTLFFEGPGKYFASEAEEAHKRGIRLYTMSNTGGLTWDIGVIPYEPAPYQWQRRYNGMTKAHTDWGLCGLMESHHFGFFPSFISELHNGQSWEPLVDFDAHIRAIATRDFGRDNADKVLEAWKCFSDGIRKYVSTDEDQYGPFRIGSAFPLLMQKNVNIPTVSYAMFGGNRICNPMYRYNIVNPDKINYEIASLTQMRDLYRKGADILESVLDGVSEAKLPDAKRMYGLARFIEHAVSTTINVKNWHILKTKLGITINEASIWQGGHALEEEESASEKELTASQKDEIIIEMLKIASSEIKNTEEVIPLTDYDSRLGFEPSMEYICDSDHLRWKIDVTKQACENELIPMLSDRSLAREIW